MGPLCASAVLRSVDRCGVFQSDSAAVLWETIRNKLQVLNDTALYSVYMKSQLTPLKKFQAHPKNLLGYAILHAIRSFSIYMRKINKIDFYLINP